MHKTSTKKVIKKVVKKSDLEAFSKAGKETYNKETVNAPKKILGTLMDGKKIAKKEIFGLMEKESDSKIDMKTPFVLIFATDLNGEKELMPREFLYSLLQGCLAVNIKVVVVDTQQPSDINNLGELTDKHEGHVIWYNPGTDNSGKNREEKEIDRLLMAADMAVVFNSHLELINLLMSYGVVLVSEDRSPLLENYKPNEETGNSFLYKKRDLWSVYASLVRALESYKFPYDWNNIVRKLYK